VKAIEVKHMEEKCIEEKGIEKKAYRKACRSEKGWKWTELEGLCKKQRGAG